jgi:hypothetical protein
MLDDCADYLADPPGPMAAVLVLHDYFGAGA